MLVYTQKYVLFPKMMLKFQAIQKIETIQKPTLTHQWQKQEQKLPLQEDMS